MSQSVAGVIALAASLLGGAGAIGGTAIAAAQNDQPLVEHATHAPEPTLAAVRMLNAPAVETIRFEQPLPGQAVNSPFGLRRLPWEEHGRLHAGIDIDAVPGEAVRATRGGMIVAVGQDGGYGRFVEVAHGGGLTSLYAHLGRAADGLAVGEMVDMGQVIAFAGNSGVSTGAHLHFEIRHDGRPLNPGAFVGKAFADEEALPLRAAGRIPRGVRIAFVSEIPAAKKAVMLARLEEDKAEKLEAAAEPVAVKKGGRPTARLAPSAAAPAAIDNAADAAAIVLPPPSPPKAPAGDLIATAG